jgi:hypothetical protein
MANAEQHASTWTVDALLQATLQQRTLHEAPHQPEPFLSLQPLKESGQLQTTSSRTHFSAKRPSKSPSMRMVRLRPALGDKKRRTHIAAPVPAEHNRHQPKRSFCQNSRSRRHCCRGARHLLDVEKASSSRTYCHHPCQLGSPRITNSHTAAAVGERCPNHHAVITVELERRAGSVRTLDLPRQKSSVQRTRDAFSSTSGRRRSPRHSRASRTRRSRDWPVRLASRRCRIKSGPTRSWLSHPENESACAASL